MPTTKVSRYVYVVTSTVGVKTPLVKIGAANDLTKRMSELRSGSPVPIELFNSFKLPHRLAKEVEGLCHKELSEFHSRGEWFKVSPETAWECVQKHGNAALRATDIDHTEKRRRAEWLINELEAFEKE